jgi:4-aminobutyrate aminotransferase-like enzyme
MGRYEVIGDVRGSGLFLGVEFVEDRESRAPAPNVLASVIETCRACGILLSSDGPRRNVLKIKPPMPFDVADAELLLSVFDRSMSVTPS